MLVIGAVALIFGVRNFAIRSLGVAACISSVYLVRSSKVHARSSSTGIDMARAGSMERRRPKPVMWLVGAALLALVGIAYLGLHDDALGGYKETFPVYFFSGVAVVCIAFWSYLLAKVL